MRASRNRLIHTTINQISESENNPIARLKEKKAKAFFLRLSALSAIFILHFLNQCR